MRRTLLISLCLIFGFACSNSESLKGSELDPSKSPNLASSTLLETAPADGPEPDMRDVGTNTSIPTVDETEYWEASTLAIMPSHPYLECLNTVFDKFVNALGVYVIATPEAPIDYVKHTANVLAQFIDNDEDGQPDDPKVHRYLVEGNFVVPVWSEKDRDTFFAGARGTYCEDNVSFRASMYHDHDRWALGGISATGTWDTNLEEVWHVVSDGWYRMYPDYFGDAPGTSKLTGAMDVARGGRFDDVPYQYPEEAWYSYNDQSCTYECQVHEYFYWALMANIGALDPALTNKCEDSADEWHVCTAEELRRIDPLVFDLLNNQGFALPAMVPDGSYRAPGN